MARIRTIKPEFFRDEDLQELQGQWTGVPVMLVFAGLWGHCDKNGNFLWAPRQLKLDILPFLPFAMEQALDLLEQGGFIRKYEASGKHYGNIPKFQDHQRISGSEATDPAKYPEYSSTHEKGSNGEAVGKQRGSSGDELVSQEGKGREGNTLSGANAPDGFSRFWRSWPPSSRKGGKAKCLAVWKAKSLESSAAEIVAHVEAMKASKQWADSQFIPMPLTYLNQSRWDGAEAGEPEKKRFVI